MPKLSEKVSMSSRITVTERFTNSCAIKTARTIILVGKVVLISSFGAALTLAANPELWSVLSLSERSIVAIAGGLFLGSILIFVGKECKKDSMRIVTFTRRVTQVERV